MDVKKLVMDFITKNANNEFKIEDDKYPFYVNFFYDVYNVMEELSQDLEWLVGEEDM